MTIRIERIGSGELLVCEDGVWQSLGHHPDGAPLPPQYLPENLSQMTPPAEPAKWERWQGTGEIVAMDGVIHPPE